MPRGKSRRCWQGALGITGVDRERLSARISGATNKLSMIASASGISTDRPKYKSARMIPVVMMRLL